jgi:hypothetical protein
LAKIFEVHLPFWVKPTKQKRINNIFTFKSKKMKKIIFLLVFLSIGIFANASVISNETCFADKTNSNQTNTLTSRFMAEEVCVTVTVLCPYSVHGSGWSTCTSCASTHTFGPAASSIAAMAATNCAAEVFIFCPAP